VVDILLILGLLAAIAYLFLVIGDGRTGIWMTAPTLAATNPLVVSSPFPKPATSTPGTPLPTTHPITATPSARPSLTSTLSPTATQTANPTATWTPTETPQDAEIGASIARADEIVAAIEAYHAARGQYPPDLNVLVTDYLPAIPLTITDQPYFYRLFADSDPLSAEVYWLAFRVVHLDHTTCTYLRRLEYWDCNFASP
ncbi:MAG TPA: hypothetical protein VGJ22_05905, partial [Anaerolineales bacterium]|jgi:hypothetical protein